MKIYHYTNDLSNKTETFIRSMLNELSMSDGVSLYCDQRGKIDVSVPKTYSFKVNEIKRQYFSFPRFYALLYKLGLARTVKAPIKFNSLELKLADVITVDFLTNVGSIIHRKEICHKPIFVFVHGYDLSKALRNVRYYKEVCGFVEFTNLSIIVPCDYFKNKLVVEFGFDVRKVFVLPYGVVKEKIHVKNYTSNRFRLLFVGRLVPKKQPLALIHMMNILVNFKKKDVQLDMVGEGPMFESVKSKIIEFKLESNITLHGSLSHECVLSIMNEANLYVQHSVTDFLGDQEGLPNSILEALSKGIPVLSTLHSGIPDIIKQGLNGILVQEFDYKSMAQKVSRIMENPDLYNSLVQAAVKNSELITHEERARMFLTIVKNQCSTS